MNGTIDVMFLQGKRLFIGGESLKLDYQEILEEVEYLLSPESFVSTCYELKEGMAFYDRDLLLSIFGAIAEVTIITLLFLASLEEEEVFADVEKRLMEKVDDFARDFEKVFFLFPIDVPYLVEEYLQGVGQELVHRLPIFFQSMRAYREGLYMEEQESLELLIPKVHQKLEAGDLPEAHRLMGLVGALMLTGKKLRPFWFRMSYPAVQSWLAGLQTAVSNLSVATHCSFPLADVQTERLKRGKEGHREVSDLGAFRNLRKGLGGFTDKRILLSPDECDFVLEALLEGQNVASLVEKILESSMKEKMLSLFADIVATPWIGRSGHRLLIQQSLELLLALDETPWVLEQMIRLLGITDPWSDLFHFCLMKLESLDSLQAIHHYVQESSSDPVYLILAELITKEEEDVFPVLCRMFEKLKWEQGKGYLGRVLARVGQKRALPLLQVALDNLPEEHGRFAGVLNEAINTAEASKV